MQMPKALSTYQLHNYNFNKIYIELSFIKVYSPSRLQTHVSRFTYVVYGCVRHIVYVIKLLVRLDGDRNVLIGPRISNVYHPLKFVLLKKVLQNV